MGRNLSFHYVIKNVREREGVDISSLILKVKNQDVVSLDVEEVSTEYKNLTEKYKQISRRQSSGEEPSAEDQHTVALWGQAHDKSQVIIKEATENIWFFFRDILRVPHNLPLEGDIPTDMREPEDYHFQMSEYGVKVLWLYEVGAVANINYCHNIQIYDLLAGIAVYEMFRKVIDYKKTGVFDDSPQMLMTANTDYALSIMHLKITQKIWAMIHELEHYSFLVDIADTLLEMMDDPFTDSSGSHILRSINTMTFNDDNVNIVPKDIREYNGFVVHNPVTSKNWITKRNADAGAINIITSSRYNFNSNPHLTFEYIMKDEDGYFANTCNAVFNINTGILEFIDNRVPQQKLYIQSMVHTYNAIMNKKVATYSIDSATSLYLNRIGYVDPALLCEHEGIYTIHDQTRDSLNYIYSRYTK